MKKQLTVLSFLSVFLYANSQDGALDANFNPNGTAYVRAIEKLADGKVLIAHSQGIGGGLKIFNPDGTDATQIYSPVPLQTEYSNNWIQDILQQTDGKVILLGSAGAVKIMRYNTDGTQDAQFQANVGTGANLNIRKGLLDADGKIVLIGDFTTFNEVPKGGIVRLNQDGTIDNSFVATTQSSILRDICHSENGGYYLAGLINNVNNVSGTNYRTARLHPNGELDTTFTTYSGNLELIALAPDNSVVGVSKTSIYRFQAGVSDDSFAGIGAGSGDATPEGLHIQTDGKIIFTGSITDHYHNGVVTPVNNVFRMNPDGTFDASFNPGAGPSNNILCSQLTDNGALLVAGVFWQFDGQNRNYVARLTNSGLPYFPGNQSAAIEQFEQDIQVRVFPNPTTDQLFFEADENIVAVTLWSMDGNQVIDLQGENIQNISLTHLAEGMYNLKLVTDNGSLIQRKIIKR